MTDRSFLEWPFFGNDHRTWAGQVEEVAKGLSVDHDNIDVACQELVKTLGKAGILRPTASKNGIFDVRKLCLTREVLSRYNGLADFSFAMQGLGTGAITLFGSDEQKTYWLPKTQKGQVISAFALTEPGSGSDVANSTMTAQADGNEFVLNGEKTWISNGGIADLYTVFARTGEGLGSQGLSAFLVTPDAIGFEISERLETIAPHPLATLKFNGCRIPKSALIGRLGDGFKISMAVLDVFRPTVAAAALGFARRAFDEALSRVTNRCVQGAPLFDLQMVQGHIADMALSIDAAALLTYRAAWAKDSGASRISREAAMAKLFSTEQAQSVIDTAVQLFGGDGVRSGMPVEQLYREIRALRIYEGASDVQKIIIARQSMGNFNRGI